MKRPKKRPVQRLMIRWLATAALACGPLLVCGGPASAQQYWGEMRLFTGECPDGWAKTDGQIIEFMKSTQNQALFSLLGTQYGGDGRTTFALPRLDSAISGTTWCIALGGQFSSRY